MGRLKAGEKEIALVVSEAVYRDIKAKAEKENETVKNAVYHAVMDWLEGTQGVRVVTVPALVVEKK